jgi:hypothetical protein
MKTISTLIFLFLLTNCSGKKTNKANLANLKNLENVDNNVATSTRNNRPDTDNNNSRPKTNAECAKEFRQSLFTEQVRTPLSSIGRLVFTGIDQNSIINYSPEENCNLERIKLLDNSEIDYYLVNIGGKSYRYPSGHHMLPPNLPATAQSIKIQGCIEYDDIRETTSLKKEIEACGQGEKCTCTIYTSELIWKPKDNSSCEKKEQYNKLFELTWGPDNNTSANNLVNKSKKFRASIKSRLKTCTGTKDPETKKKSLQSYSYALCGMFLNYSTYSFADILDQAFLAYAKELTIAPGETNLALSQSSPTSESSCFERTQDMAAQNAITQAIATDTNAIVTDANSAEETIRRSTTTKGSKLLALASLAVAAGAIFLAYSVKEKYWTNSSLFYWHDSSDYEVLKGQKFPFWNPPDTEKTPRKRKIQEAYKQLEEDLKNLNELKKTNASPDEIKKLQDKAKGSAQKLDFEIEETWDKFIDKKQLKRAKTPDGSNVYDQLLKLRNLASNVKYNIEAKVKIEAITLESKADLKNILVNETNADRLKRPPFEINNQTDFDNIKSAKQIEIDNKISVLQKVFGGVRLDTVDRRAKGKSATKMALGLGAAAVGMVLYEVFALTQSQDMEDFLSMLQEEANAIELLLKDIKKIKVDLGIDFN